MLITLDMIPLQEQDVVSRTIDGEAVLVTPAQGEVKVINEVGARIWEVCDGQISASQIVELICNEYQVERDQAEKDVLEFLEALYTRGLIVVSGS